MKINSFINTNTTFKSGYDKELRNLFKEAGTILNYDKDSMCNDVLIIDEGSEKGLVKKIDNKTISISNLFSDCVLFQIADSSNETIDVYYHNSQDEYCGKYLKYKDNKIFPWYAGKDIKLFSKRIKNMSTQEIFGLKNILKKYIPKFIKKIN